jgi:glycerol-3-phosphate dehydrogenase
MERGSMLEQLTKDAIWDMVIIGGGATGVGCAIDAASRGYKTILVEQFDFAKGTSSKSTKLVHGGVRYLEQGNIKLVMEALRERGHLLKNAAHLTHVQAFIIPVFSLWEQLFYTIGLKIYDILSGTLSLGKTKLLSKNQTIQQIPSINAEKLYGGVLYYDGQFDDSLLCVEMAQTAVQLGATALNYCKASNFIKDDKGKIIGLVVEDALNKKTYQVKTKVVINATGVFTNAVMQLDDAHKHEFVSPSQGIHLVVDNKYFSGTAAMMIPKTSDGRVLFAVPWHQKVILGTTDTPVNTINIEPKPLNEEVEFILNHFNKYCATSITRNEVLSVYVGLRPLVNNKNSKAKTAQLSRAHSLTVSDSGLVTITGGKWTTYRSMAQDAVNNAVFVAKLERKKCITTNLPIGNLISRLEIVNQLKNTDPVLSELIHPKYLFIKAEIIYAIRNQMAMTLEDVLARRIRLLFLDARVAIAVAPMVASIMAKELNKDADWTAAQVNGFNLLAKQYIF